MSFREVCPFIPGDYELLMSEAGHYSTCFNDYDEYIFRLEALGLIIETNSTSAFHEHSGGFAITPQSLERVSKGVKEYDRTGLGNKFVSIMNGDGDGKED